MNNAATIQARTERGYRIDEETPVDGMIDVTTFCRDRNMSQTAVILGQDEEWGVQNDLVYTTLQYVPLGQDDNHPITVLLACYQQHAIGISKIVVAGTKASTIHVMGINP